MTLDSITYRYHKHAPQVLTDVSGHIRAGRITAIIGPNGAGKSTLLRTMLGDLIPTIGTVTLENQTVHAMDHLQRANAMAYVPQRGGGCFGYTVQQVVAMSRAMIGGQAGIDYAIEQCNLTKIRSRVFTHLSVGQQQRVLLARGIAQCFGQGRLLLLDEPCSAMDLKHIYQTMDLLIHLVKQGLSVVIVLHDLNLVSRYADEVWLMDRGRLISSGPREKVLQASLLSDVYGVEIRIIDENPSARPMIFPVGGSIMTDRSPN